MKLLVGYGGNFETIKDSIIHKLFMLPDDVTVYPGHGQDTSIGYEKEHNKIFGGVKWVIRLQLMDLQLQVKAL